MTKDEPWVLSRSHNKKICKAQIRRQINRGESLFSEGQGEQKIILQIIQRNKVWPTLEGIYNLLKVKTMFFL